MKKEFSTFLMLVINVLGIHLFKMARRLVFDPSEFIRALRTFVSLEKTFRYRTGND